MSAGISLKTTRYGLSAQAGGWDPDGDSGTDQFHGDGIPGAGYAVLNRSACALTATAEDALARSLLAEGVTGPKELMRLPIGTALQVTYPDARFDRVCVLCDRAPESDMRLDIFLPYHDDPSVPEYGTAAVLKLPA